MVLFIALHIQKVCTSIQKRDLLIISVIFYVKGTTEVGGSSFT